MPNEKIGIQKLRQVICFPCLGKGTISIIKSKSGVSHSPSAPQVPLHSNH